MPGMKADAAQQRRAALLAVQCCALVPLSTARRTAGELLGEYPSLAVHALGVKLHDSLLQILRHHIDVHL